MWRGARGDQRYCEMSALDKHLLMILLWNITNTSQRNSPSVVLSLSRLSDIWQLSVGVCWGAPSQMYNVYYKSAHNKLITIFLQYNLNTNWTCPENLSARKLEFKTLKLLWEKCLEGCLPLYGRTKTFTVTLFNLQCKNLVLAFTAMTMIFIIFYFSDGAVNVRCVVGT